MRNSLDDGLDFRIDKLTKSIEEVASGQSEPTFILPVELADIHLLMWHFDWMLEFNLVDRYYLN